jgi:glycosyltransferase involved in cell wall biosynthesis
VRRERDEVVFLFAEAMTPAERAIHLARAFVERHRDVPSIAEEAFGPVALEAIAAGKPVIAFRIGGIPEIVDQRSGILAAPGDVSALGEAMSQLGIGAAFDRRA